MDYAEHNWNVVKHVFQNYVTFSNGRLVNVCLNPTIFEALSHALHKKRFCPKGRLRADDSLILAIGNWLFTLNMVPSGTRTHSINTSPIISRLGSGSFPMRLTTQCQKRWA